MNAKAQLVERAEAQPVAAAKGPGLVRRYEYPSAPPSGAFAACAASLLAELDALPEALLERAAVCAGRAKGRR
jgi:hypothetical protein